MEHTEAESEESSRQDASDGIDAEDVGHEDLEPETSQVSTPRLTLSENDEKALGRLKELGVESNGETAEFVKYVRPNDRPRFRAETGIPHAAMQDLIYQLTHKIIQHPTTIGLIVPSRGYAEIVFRDIGWPRLSVTSENILRLKFDKTPCVHDEPGRQLKSLPFTPLMRGREAGEQTNKLHLASPGRGHVSNCQTLHLWPCCCTAVDFATAHLFY
jgi:hypothetical protein